MGTDFLNCFVHSEKATVCFRPHCNVGAGIWEQTWSLENVRLLVLQVFKEATHSDLTWYSFALVNSRIVHLHHNVALWLVQIVQRASETSVEAILGDILSRVVQERSQEVWFWFWFSPWYNVFVAASSYTDLGLKEIPFLLNLNSTWSKNSVVFVLFINDLGWNIIDQFFQTRSTLTPYEIRLGLDRRERCIPEIIGMILIRGILNYRDIIWLVSHYRVCLLSFLLAEFFVSLEISTAGLRCRGKSFWHSFAVCKTYKSVRFEWQMEVFRLFVLQQEVSFLNDCCTLVFEETRDLLPRIRV